MNKLLVDPKITNVNKFYFLEYFYILLKSVEKYSKKTDIFESFRNRKDSLQLGESKYRKLILPEEQLSSKKLMRYEYTFKEVMEESESYGLLEKKNEQYFISPAGSKLIRLYESNITLYEFAIFELMESKSQGFYYLVKCCYEANPSGLLIFPTYSPFKLGLQKNHIRKTKDIVHYLDVLVKKLTEDIREHLHIEKNLQNAKEDLLTKLRSNGILLDDLDSEFDISNYNKIVKRIRDYWLNYFLSNIYNIGISLSYFDIWCYRGKQLGIINATEFYYNFDGKVVYPTSIVAERVASEDFKKFFLYPGGEILYIHSPNFEMFKDTFIAKLFESYIDIKSKVKTYFINLADLRDLVCFKLRISYGQFAEYLEHIYQLNLKNQTRISISLETDKLPSETKAMYLTREPIMIDNQSRNIIALEIKK